MKKIIVVSTLAGMLTLSACGPNAYQRATNQAADSLKSCILQKGEANCKTEKSLFEIELRTQKAFDDSFNAGGVNINNSN